jgi:CubicO group peptidase (beta-lactamase class C family)
MREGEITQEYFQGAADLESGTQINRDTLFHIASLAKQFTALAILQLKEQGLLQLDHVIENYWPEFSLKNHGITIRHLLNHTSGIHDQWSLLEWAGWRKNSVITTDDVIEIISRLRQVQFSPGTRFRYCNTGYTILAYLVSSLTGMPFHQYVQQYIFIPLGMSNSLVAHDPQAIICNRAQAYCFDPQTAKYFKDSPQLYVEGPTSVFTSISDYTRWMAAHSPGTKWREYIDEMTVPGLHPQGSATKFGLAYFIEDSETSPITYHTGRDSGFTSIFMHDVTNHQAVAIFTNAAIENLRPIALDCIGKNSVNKNRKKAACSEHAGGGSFDKHDQGLEYTGTYQSELGEIQPIIYKNRRLVSIWGKEVELVKVVGDHWESTEEAFMFERNAEQEISQLLYTSQFGTTRWRKMNSTAGGQDKDNHIPLGAYYSSIIDAFLWIVERSNKSYLILPKQQPIQLRKQADDLYLADAVWLHYMKNEQVIWLSAPRCLNVPFSFISLDTCSTAS